ncbi:unnamed protein product [Orchesella dallaii]|uniref:EB domain-containing protein n=1 Tax=Orchesella dallaii TaxID=48710 RepID=A0ABP1PSA6_9HEXA
MLKILWCLVVLYLPLSSSYHHDGAKMIIGGKCTVNSNCEGIPGVSSECSEGTCYCKPGYLPTYVLDDCLEIISRVGNPCEQTLQCMEGSLGPLSDCIGGRCFCGEGSVYNSAEGVCSENH